MSEESELTLPSSQYLWGPGRGPHPLPPQCLEAGAQAASESHQHQAHRPAWVSPLRLYLRSGPPSSMGEPPAASAWLLLLLNRKTGFLASPSGHLP